MAKEEIKKPVIKKPIKKIVEAVEVKEPVHHIADDDFDTIELVTEHDLTSKPDKYFEAIGRRKTAIARVRLFTRGEKAILVNGVSYKEYFKTSANQATAVASLVAMKCLDKFRITVIVRGGGINAQAEAVRHGMARVLVDFNNNFKKRLRKVGYLTRDPRMRERKKFGLKRARKAPQWAKR